MVELRLNEADTSEACNESPLWIDYAKVWDEDAQSYFLEKYWEHCEKLGLDPKAERRLLPGLDLQVAQSNPRRRLGSPCVLGLTEQEAGIGKRKVRYPGLLSGFTPA